MGGDLYSSGNYGLESQDPHFSYGPILYNSCDGETTEGMGMGKGTTLGGSNINGGGGLLLGL